jgi:bifunctional oligoribonuclease and PAP phosphatase NrnA
VRYDLADWDAAVAVLRDAREVALACHVNPDGDALGSLLAASEGLRRMGKPTYPSWGTSPVKAPFAYSFLPGVDTLLQPEDVPETDVFLALDCGSSDRLESLESLAHKATSLINVDHHPGNEEFGTLNVVVTTASSTAEIVTYLLDDIGVDIDLGIATNLYTGIVTDTGRFQYSNSSPDTLRLAAGLLEKGVSAPAIAKEVFDSSPFGYLKLLGRVLERATLHEDDRFVYSWITQKDLAETGVALDETEKLIDLVRATRAADVTAMFKEQDDGSWRVSLRSKGPNVGALARSRGGGGHDLAAGFSSVDIDRTVADLIAELK